MSEEGRLIAGRYRLVEKVGRGGMGTVWRSEDELLGRQVAVKQLHVSMHLSDDELTTLHERTRREARSAARITHPNVVVVHDVVDHEGLPCIVMEYVPSTTLADLLKDGGTISPVDAARIGRGMIAALRAAHAAGVLHRDVKPGNVLLGPEGRVVLTDFGIAMATGTSTLTKTGEVVGSIDYIAPERVRGRTPGPASDLWALGATLYQAVEGRAPFRKATAIETGYAIAVDPLDPPTQAGPLTALIEALLAKDPEQRPSAEDTERALRVPASEADTTALPLPRFGPVPGETPSGSTTHAPAAPTTPPAPATPPTSAVAGYPPAAGAPYGTPEPVSGDSGSTPAPKKSRKSPWIAAGAALAVVATAAGVYVFGLDHSVSNADGPDQATTAPARPGQSSKPTPAYTPPATPEGYHVVTEDKLGVSFPVPDGWTRQGETDPEGTVDRTQEVRYLDPQRLVRLTIDVLDFAPKDQVEHFKELEPKFQETYPVYDRMRLQSTKFRGQKAAVWEFRFQGQARSFRAIDLGFGEEGGKQYAIYLSAPEAEWAKYRPIFDAVREGFVAK
ncbi:protein kinase [Streptomyces sp. NA02950]|uniref:serine/threonine-protein kinase n=1 Tax=Streptomyces sp. NA02950 TaxID=2742137 RepID=UPI001591F635|nr:serine/threonine-protein kinase [Streptomyces sp. NA02950]QKV94401.1 protein kinase [Streptomyces sp. NA02950]